MRFPRIDRLILMTFAFIVSMFFDDSTFAQDAEAKVALIPRAAEWHYRTETGERPKAWNEIEFNHEDWKKGKAGFGYGDGDDRTLLNDMQGNYNRVLIRRMFQVADPAKLKRIYLYVNYDDGFIAHLNGIEVAAGAANRDPKTGIVRLHTHEASGFEEFVIRNADEILRKGSNVLAIEGYNAGETSSDFSLDPFLRSTPQKRGASNESELRFTASEYLADLDELRERLLDQSSYLTRRGFDYDSAIIEFRNSISDDMKPLDFVIGVRKIVAQLGDCHSRVEPLTPPRIGGFLPFRIADTSRGVAALKVNADTPYDKDFPYLDSLDGRSINEWSETAGQHVPHGSPQFRRRQSIQHLVYFDLLRDELGVRRSLDVRIGLRGEGDRKTVVRGRLSRQPWSVARVKQRPTRRLESNIGYIRIPRMDERSIDLIANWIYEFRDTNGLIIDVRNNGGGTYGVLRGIYPFFVPVESPPRVTNIAAFRLSDRFRPDHIAYRPTYRAEWNGWDDIERTAIAEAMKQFQPKWNPPEDKFSKWHFMLLSRKRSGRPNGFQGNGESKRVEFFYYAKPVAVLSNAGSFSATDGFLSAFASIPNVTILGEPSGGGSGATRQFRLKNTNTKVAISSMASFRPNGKTFDGHGVAVDISMKPSLADFVSESDSILERAVEQIVAQTEKNE